MTNSAPSILIVDDEQNMRLALYEALTRNGYRVEVAEHGRMALEMIGRSRPDLVITDIRMPEMDGIELLRQVRKADLTLPFLVITGYATVPTALEAMKQGAADYILKPFSVDVIEGAVARVLLSQQQESRPIAAASRHPRNVQRPVIGQDPKMLEVLAKARKVASSKATVLILGESGTGKEVLARYLHTESNRCRAPFVALNCAALPEGLLESELFGHEKGAFTGAVSLKKGKFELADGGTLLLDEIGEIPLHLQAKLLRVLQEEEVDRLGGKAPVAVDVHVLATTNRSLEEAVEGGSFRQDLYYRLNVISLHLPPLRDRADDILLLADHFITKYSAKYGRPVKPLSPPVRQRFLRYRWPGNVREMENVIERAVLLSETDQFVLDDFWDAPETLAVKEQPLAAGPDGQEGKTLKEVERQMILQALRKTDDNRTHAARMLGVSVRTLRNKLQEYRRQGYLE